MNYVCITKQCEDDAKEVTRLETEKNKKFDWDAFAKDLIWVDADYGFDPFMSML